MRYHPVDLTLGGVRLQVSTSAATAAEHRYRLGLLHKLQKAGDIDTWRALKDGRLTVLDLVAADKAGRLHNVADELVVFSPLKTAMEAWLPRSAHAKDSRRRYGTSWRRFLSRAFPNNAAPIVADLASVDYAALGESWGAGPADWNRARASVSAFLTAYLGGDKFHPFRRKVMARFPMQPEPPGRIPTLTPAQFWAIVDAADPRCAPSFVTMAALAVGPAEYLALTREDLDPDNLTVRVRGTKTPGRARRVVRDAVVAFDPRVWEWIDRAVPAALAYRWLNRYWQRACKAAKVVGVRMYDLRHLSAQLAGDAGVTDRDLTVHLRHATPTMSHRYSRRAVAWVVAERVADELLRGRKAG
jgi:integrase